MPSRHGNVTATQHLEVQGIKISLLADRKGSEITCFKSPDVSRTRKLFFEARNGTQIRLRIKITPSFLWLGANALCVYIRLGQVNPLKSFRIVKIGDGRNQEVLLDTFTVWDEESQAWCDAQFEICLDDVNP